MIREKFIETITAHNLLQHGDRVMVAVSGGADSVALLHLFLEIREQYDLELSIAHLNHKLRGIESDADEEFVRELADHYHLDCFTEGVSLRDGRWNPKGNLEKWARTKRYEFLRHLAEVQGTKRIALGHTMNDQAETVLMRLIRGSGTLGLAAIPVVREEIFIRPLLNVYREEIIDYLTANQFDWREDSSNSDSKYLRNRVRKELIPYLKDQYNPSIIELLSNTATILREDAETLSQLVSRVFQSEATVRGERIVWKVPKLLSFRSGLQKNLVRQSLLELRQNLHSISARDINAVLSLLREKKSGKFLKVGGIMVGREYDFLFFEKAKPEAKEQVHYNYRLGIPGQVKLREMGALFEAFVEVSQGEKDILTRWEFHLSHEEVNSGVWIRNWKPGDAYCPVGFSGEKKIKELFAQKKISRSVRSAWPVVTIDDKIIFAKGFPVSADKRFKESSDRNHKVVIEERKLEGETRESFVQRNPDSQTR